MILSKLYLLYLMKTSIEFLPEDKRQELEKVVKIILENKKDKRLGMIILFGSYATNKWVDEIRIDKKGTTHQIKSDFDLLLITKKEIEARFLETHISYFFDDLDEEYIKRGEEMTQVNAIAHGIDFVNEKLQDCNYFFRDIYEQGIILYDNEKLKLGTLGILTTHRRKEKAQEFFDEWFESANIFYLHFEYAFQDNHLKKAAFELHQAAENYYTTFLLVYADYKPYIHDLKKLERMSIVRNREMGKIFPRKNKEEKRLFLLLKEAYVRARYDPKYKITKEELEYLSKRIKVMRKTVELLCKEYIKELENKI